MKRKTDPKRDPELLLVDRAGRRARSCARKTGTLLVVYRRGKVEKVTKVAENGSGYLP